MLLIGPAATATILNGISLRGSAFSFSVELLTESGSVDQVVSALAPPPSWSEASVLLHPTMTIETSGSQNHSPLFATRAITGDSWLEMVTRTAVGGVLHSTCYKCSVMSTVLKAQCLPHMEAATIGTPLSDCFLGPSRRSYQVPI